MTSDSVTPAARGGSVTIGNFDGVHRGHRAMLASLVSSAKRDGHRAVAVTFHPHPLTLLRPDATPPQLTTIAHRTALLRAAGADEVVVLPTSPELLRLTAVEFFETIIVGELEARRLVEGPNFFFGRGRGGNITVLRGLCLQHGIDLEVIEPVTIDGQWVSSSVIRSLISDGDIDDAVALLGHPYRLTGRVVEGARRGRQLGFPTANLDACETVVPGSGVYAGWCDVNGTVFPAAIHIGPNPTFDDRRPKVEVHLPGFTGDLYGRVLDVDFQSRVRDVRRFESVEGLRAQLRRDVDEVVARALSK